MQPGDIRVDIDGPLSPYEYTFRVDESTDFVIGKTTSSFSILLTFNSRLMGNDKGKLE